MKRDISVRAALATVALVAGLTAIAGAEAEAPLQLSMEECVRRALRNSEEVRSAELGVKVAEGRIEEARSAVFPQVEASVGYTRQSGLGAAGAGFGEAMSVMGIDTDNFYTANLTLSQIIYQAEVRYGLKAAWIAAEQAEVSRELVDLGVTYGVQAAYAAVLLGEAFEKAAAESVDLARKHLADVLAKRRAGTVTDFEVLQARVQLRGAQAFEIKARSAVRLGRAKLLRVLALDQGLEIELTDSLSYEPEEVPGLDELLGEATGAAFGAAVGMDGGEAGPARPELRVMDLAIDLQRIAVAVATAGRKPSVFMQASYTGGAFKDYFHEDFEMDWQVSLMVKVPVFDGFRARGKETQAAAELEQLRLKRQSLVRDIEYEIRSALSRVETAREFVESQRENVTEAEEAVRLAVVRYESGLVPEIAVETARVGLAQARSNLAQARFDHFMATLDLKKAAGSLEVPPTAKR